MGYQNYYLSRANLIEFASWYDVRTLMLELKHIKKTNFAITASRVAAHEKLGNLIDQAPYSSDKRFPENAMYICDALGDWSRKFSQLRSSLSFKMSDKDGRGKDADLKSQEYNDAHTAFVNVITSMYDQIIRRDGIIDREIFERENTNGWVE